MSRNYLLAIIGIIFMSSTLSGCQTSGTSGGYYSAPETPQCRAARSNYQICYGTCLMNTPGGTLAAMSQCGNQCMDYSFQVNIMCAR